jgi:phospholipase/carboxylesterase
VRFNIRVSFDLAYRDRPPRTSSEASPPCLVLLHGYGSNELDLLGLGDALDPRLHLVSVRAPRPLGPQAFAWFDLDWTAEGPIPDQEQALEARAVLIDFLKTVPERFGVEPQFTLGGFSQGAIMSLGIALAEPSLLWRVLMMSGRVMPAFVPQQPDARLSGILALVQHGLQDPVLSFEGSRQAAEVLTSFGATVKHVEYPMGHEVSQRSLADVRDWMNETA